MTKELSNKNKCLLTREGIEIWITDEQAEKISLIIQSSKENKLIDIGDNTVSVNSISGIYSAKSMEEMRRRKNGQWQCEFCKRWHDKFEKCGCQGGQY